MTKISAVGLFCEDIREEKGGTVTLVGIFPDNINVPNIGVVMPKLCAYVRVNFPAAYDPDSYTVFLRFPNGSTSAPSKITADILQKARSEAKNSGNPLVGTISHFVFSPYQVTELGQLEAVVKHIDSEFICGSLNFRMVHKGS